MSQSAKVISSKMKKSSREREKRKSSGSSDIYHNEKSSPTREYYSKRYAGLGNENIRAAAEQMTPSEIISDEICEVLAEDLNYKIRYIIHQALNRAIVSNRNNICSSDIDETLTDLSLDKVFGAPSEPLWIPSSEQNCLILNDIKVNIITESEKRLPYFQPINTVFVKSWLPEETKPSASMQNYFKVICEAVVSSDIDLRKMALQNISSNPNLGTIIKWFYNFGFLLLEKYVTDDDSLTLYALDLVETLEMSPLGNTEVLEDQLHLLVRLLLQRLLKSFTNPNILKSMCWVLSILCRRNPIRQLVMMKLIQKIPELEYEYFLPLLMIINSLGMDAIKGIFLENIDFFLCKLPHNWESLYGYAVMETYNILYKHCINEMSFHDKCPEIRDFMVIVYRPIKGIKKDENREKDFIGMKKELRRTIRKIEYTNQTKKYPYESVFQTTNYKGKMRVKMEKHYRTYQRNTIRPTHVEIGKFSILLPVLKSEHPMLMTCSEHTLLSYNI